MDQEQPGFPGSEGGGPVITTDHERAPAHGLAGVVPSFLAELTRAMQAAAERQREEIATVIDDDAAGQVEIARKRGAAEAGELRRAAERDVNGIQAWAAEETERIRREASQRSDQRRKELDAHLAKHESIIDQRGRRRRTSPSRTTDRRSTTFFGESVASQPSRGFARLAGSLPPPPDLESVRGLARADAVAKFTNAPDDAADDGSDNTSENSAEDAVAAELEPAADEAEQRYRRFAADESRHKSTGRPMNRPPTSPGSVSWTPRLSGGPRICPAEPAREAIAVSAQHETAAARFLRSIAPWVADRDHEDHGTHAS